MSYKTKADTALKNEMYSIISDVLNSFTYEEVELLGGELPKDELKPFRYFVRENGRLTAVLDGEKNNLADVELMAVAVNMMLALEIDGFELKVGHGKASSLDEESDALDMIDCVCDMLDGYGLSDYVKADATGNSKYEDLQFFCISKDKILLDGGRKDDKVELNIDMDLLTEFKKGNVELKDPVPVVLVASDFPELSYQVAFGLRRQGLKTEGYVSGGSMTEAEEYCLLKGISTLIWATEQTVVMKNVQTGETAETTLEKLLNK
ncbi:MAG: hypothetical protein IKJ06_01200 [Clostridia bacterium]|nr:hypothetical protein [Clostridia bacterium]